MIVLIAFIGSNVWGHLQSIPFPEDKTFSHRSGMQFPPKLGNWERFAVEADDDPTGYSTIAYGYKESPAISRVVLRPVSKRTLDAELEKLLNTLPKEVFREIKIVDQGEYLLRQGDQKYAGRFVRFTFTEADDKQRTEMSFYVCSVGNWLITFKHRFPETAGISERERTIEFMQSLTLPKS